MLASKGGAPTAPDWLRNLRANGKVSIEVDAEIVEVAARVAEHAERKPIWAKQKAGYPQFAEYEASTTREIPVVLLELR